MEWVLPDQVSVVSTVIATLFLRTTLHSSSVSDGQTYLGLIFFAIIHMVRTYTFILSPSYAVHPRHGTFVWLHTH